jgi:hypothetical protein
LTRDFFPFNILLSGKLYRYLTKQHFKYWRVIMMCKKIILSAIGGLFILATASSYAVQVQTDEEVVAREASEGPRGGDNERPGDRQHRGGRLINDAGVDILARRGADDPPGTEAPGDNHRQRRGGRLINDEGIDILARRGADDPPGTEAPGDNHRQRRGGRVIIDSGEFILAREASEGPRGADNERPGDRQHRGGRNA